MNIASMSLYFQVSGWTLKTMTLQNPHNGCCSNANLHTMKDVVMAMAMETSFGAMRCKLDSIWFWRMWHKVETPYHDNDVILTPIISPQSGWR